MFDYSKKAVLWDLDDTLYSRVDAARQTFPGMFREHLYVGRSDAFIAEAVGYMMTQVKRNSMIHEEAFQALLGKYPPDKPYVRADCLSYYYRHITDYVVPFPGMVGILEKLRERGIKTAIVSNIIPERLDSQRKKVERLGIAHLFDAVILSGDLGIHKPDRRIFDLAASSLGVSDAECLFVGDDPESDIVGALGAGMEAVFIDRWGAEELFVGDTRVHRVRSAAEYFEV